MKIRNRTVVVERSNALVYLMTCALELKVEGSNPGGTDCILINYINFSRCNAHARTRTSLDFRSQERHEVDTWSLKGGLRQLRDFPSTESSASPSPTDAPRNAFGEQDCPAKNGTSLALDQLSQTSRGKEKNRDIVPKKCCHNVPQYIMRKIHLRCTSSRCQH